MTLIVISRLVSEFTVSIVTFILISRVCRLAPFLVAVKSERHIKCDDMYIVLNAMFMYGMEGILRLHGILSFNITHAGSMHIRGSQDKYRVICGCCEHISE